MNIEITKEEVENITKEYLKNGGDLFTVTGIDTIRDGGTMKIITNKDSYYVNKDTYEFHTKYPTSHETKINDHTHKAYLMIRIISYLKKYNLI